MCTTSFTAMCTISFTPPPFWNLISLRNAITLRRHRLYIARDWQKKWDCKIREIHVLIAHHQNLYENVCLHPSIIFLRRMKLCVLMRSLYTVQIWELQPQFTVKRPPRSRQASILFGIDLTHLLIEDCLTRSHPLCIKLIVSSSS